MSVARRKYKNILFYKSFVYTEIDISYSKSSHKLTAQPQTKRTLYTAQVYSVHNVTRPTPGRLRPPSREDYSGITQRTNNTSPPV